jgi:glyoxylase-like metal-dependent hydrolase (beta-lactamase superfamily II)
MLTGVSNVPKKSQERIYSMKVLNHGNDLIQLTYYGFVNVYLVREEDGFTLIDTALESCASSIMQVAQQFGQPIVRILLTHAHADHSGGLDALNTLVPEAEFIMPTRDARFLTGDMSLDPGEPAAKLRGGWVIRKTRPTRLVQEGDSVGSLEVIATPGHTPGHMSFLDTRNGTLLTGDAFDTMAGIAVSGTLKPLFPLVALATWHKPSCLESARKLRALSPSRLAVGHGSVLNQPLAAMDRAIGTLARELERKAKMQVPVARV